MARGQVPDIAGKSRVARKTLPLAPPLAHPLQCTSAGGSQVDTRGGVTSHGERCRSASRALTAIETDTGGVSLVDVILLACDFSDDQTEIADLIDDLVGSGRAQLLPFHEDRMFASGTETADCAEPKAA